MKSGTPWQVSGVTRQTRQAAREAARRAGLSVGEWLDSVIAQSAHGDGQGPDDHPQDGAHAYSAERQYREQEESEREPRRGYASELFRRVRRSPMPHPQGEEEQDEAPAEAARRAELEQTLPLARQEAGPVINRGFAELHARLDDLALQLNQVANVANAARHEEREDDETHKLVAVVSKLDRRLDQLIAEGRSSKEEIERKVNAVGRAVADLVREPVRAPAASAALDVPTPLDQALSEIADRQRALDGYAPASAGAASAPERPAASVGLPRARTQELSGLEQQLRQINGQIEGLKPCGVGKAIDTLRDDLAEIGLMLQDAMPRKSVEALEREMRKLSERIDVSRSSGGDGAALVNIEQGLAEVRDALRGLTPADNLAGVDRELHSLSQKIDGLAHASQDPAALRELEGAIVALRGIVSHAASNEALASLSDEVRALAGKVDRAADPHHDTVLNALEERIGALADALAARNQGGERVPRELEAVIAGLADKIERVQLTHGEHNALGHLEDRIAKLVEKLDGSDARLNQLEAIERGLAELLIHIEHQRPLHGAETAAAMPHVDALSRDLANLRDTEEKTQHSLELVHGTLGHVVDRLAMIESDMRSSSATGRTTGQGVTPRDASPKPETGRGAKGAKAKVAPKSASPEPSPEPPVLSRSLSREAPDAFSPLQEAGLHVDQRWDRPTGAEAEAPWSERRPIEPDLPPDHPLEPGSRDARPSTSAAERIAASESALSGSAAGAPAETPSSSSFIAAARRAAQAATREKPAKRSTSAPQEMVAAASKLAGRLGKLRALITGAAAFAIVVGGFQIVRNYLSSSAESDPPSAQTEIAPAAPAQPDAPKVEATPAPAPRSSLAPNLPVAPSVPVPPNLPVTPSPSVSPKPLGVAPKPSSVPDRPAGRQSALVPAVDGITEFPMAAGIAPGSTPAGIATTLPAIPPAALAQSSTASAAPASEVTGSIPALAAAPKPPGVAPATPAPTPAERLPAAFAGSLRMAAAKNDPTAQYEIAVRYADGRGVAQDPAAAAEWFERAAKQGLAPAQFRLGGMYEKGLGVKKNLEAARRLYVAAGQAGNAKAVHNLAVLYAEGIDGKPDYEIAARWFRKAADYGIADSQYNLAVLYARGIGVEQNLTEAYRWFSLAARAGDAESAKKRDELGARLDQQSLSAALQAVQAWSAQKQPEAAVEVKTPPGGWGQAAATPILPAYHKPMALAPKLDLATPRAAQ